MCGDSFDFNEPSISQFPNFRTKVAANIEGQFPNLL